MITRAEILRGREVEFPLTPELEENLYRLLEAVNKLRALYGEPMFVSSGYRPGHYNKDAGGAAKSSHLTCEAVDFSDPTGKIKSWILSNKQVLELCGLYMENPTRTVGWVHLQIRPTAGRIFQP